LASGPSALQVTAIGNLVLFLIAFRLFVGRLVRGTHAPFYTLVFVLVLWGSAP
jgi:hypothetical protein